MTEPKQPSHRQADLAPVKAETTVTPCAEPAQPTRGKGSKPDARQKEE